MTDRHVPCKDCYSCCSGPGRSCKLDSDDEPRHYHTYTDADGNHYLAIRPDGTCLYLVAGKCSIYERRPNVCRRFDCRDYIKHPLMHVRRAAERLRMVA